jgi:hypothetical protein
LALLSDMEMAFLATAEISITNVASDADTSALDCRVVSGLNPDYTIEQAFLYPGSYAVYSRTKSVAKGKTWTFKLVNPVSTDVFD